MDFSLDIVLSNAGLRNENVTHLLNTGSQVQGTMVQIPVGKKILLSFLTYDLMIAVYLTLNS